MGRFLSADSSGRSQLIEEGIAVAGRRRQEMKTLIQEDPEMALARSVPYASRREFPPEIIAQLETPVSAFAQFQLIVYCSNPGHAEIGHTGSEYERIAKFGGKRYEVHTFGRRFKVTTKDLLSIHGIAIDEALAMAEDPVRTLSESEREDRGLDADIAVSVGGNVYGAFDVEAVKRLRKILEEDEGSLGPQLAAGYRALLREDVDGVSLLFAQEQNEENNFAVLSEVQSAHTLGPKTMLYMRARFSDQDPDYEPIDLATLKERQAGVEAFWYESSYGKSSLTTTFTDTVTLPNSTSHYSVQGRRALGPLLEDAAPLAKAAGRAKGRDWDAANYDFYTLLTEGGDWIHSGVAALGGRVSHLPRIEATGIQTANHEFGHNLGLYHANYWRTDSTSPIGRDSIPGGYVGDAEGDEWREYGNLFTPMGNLTPLGYKNYDYEEFSYATGEKAHLDWLVAEDGDWVSVEQTTATPIRLYRHDVEAEYFSSRILGVTRAIKINVDSGDYFAADKRRYWLSYRHLPGKGILGNWLPYGLQVEWQRENYGADGSILLDMTPYTIGSAANFRADSISTTQLAADDNIDGVVVIGRTYSDEKADIHFTPIAQGGENPNEWIDVLINIGTQEENTDPEITSFTASSTEVEIGEEVDFSVKAEDRDGDPLYYSWTFGDNSMVVESLNSRTASKSWKSERGIYPVRVTVSDGKGGSDSKEIHVAVGPVSDFLAIRGRVTFAGSPVKDAIVKLYSEWEDSWSRQNMTRVNHGWTDGDGNYFLLHSSADTENWLTVLKDGFSFRPLFPNPVYLGNSNVTEKDWVGFPNNADRTPAIRLTSPKSPFATVPQGSGLLLEAKISEDNFPNPSGKLAVNWSVSGAPKGGEVTFSPPQGLATVANFNVPGFYSIQISATHDGLNEGTTEFFVRTGLNPDDYPASADAAVYLTMDEGQGTTATDSRGGNNNGSLVNGASWTEPNGGILGTGIVLDGIDDQIHIENTDGITELFNFYIGRTITFWFKADDPLRKTKQALYQEGDQSRGLNIYLEAGKLHVGGWITGPSGLKETFLSTELIDTDWHHVALVQRPERNPLTIFPSLGFRGFLDGKELGTGNGNLFEVRTIVLMDRNITLGASRVTTRYHDGVGFGTGNHFDGILDEFHSWNRALSRLESGQQLFRQSIMGPELILSSVDHSNGSVVIPPGMGIVLDGATSGNGSPVTKWETVMAPEGGQTTFGDPAHPNTVAAFSIPGYYKLRLTADDGMQKSAIDVDVHAGLDTGSDFYSPEEVVYYSMDEGTGDRVRNSADENEPGVLSNPTGWTSEEEGISGAAIRFDGIDDGLEMGNHSLSTKSFHAKSFAFWIKPNEMGTGNKEIILLEAGRSSGLNIYLDGEALYFGAWNDTGIPWETYLPVPITRGKWSHLALVFDPENSGLRQDDLRAYLDGRQVASGMAASGIDYRMDLGTLGKGHQHARFHDGPADSVINYAFRGALDEFHYYQDHALTIDEIGILYALGNVGPKVNAGPDQLVDAPSSMILLEGSSTDDERWSSPVTYSWYFLDGPEAGGFRLLEENGASAKIDPLTLGSHRIALGAYDGQVTTFDELIVTVRQPTQFELFMDDFPAIAVEDRSYHADPDGDHRTNLAEYALGGAPDLSETWFQLGLQHELVREANHWYAGFRYPRRRDAAQRGLRYEFQVSFDLSSGSWMNQGYTVLEITPKDDIFEEVRLRINQPLRSSDPRLFGRVKIYLNE